MLGIDSQDVARIEHVNLDSVTQSDQDSNREYFENRIDNWLRQFQKENYDFVKVDARVLDTLARALCDDIPLGYEASHRLASWIFSYLNRRANKY